MSGEGSFPHQQPQPEIPEDPPEQRASARVLEFPTEDSKPGAHSDDVPSGTWADGDLQPEAPASDDDLLRPAGSEPWEGGEVVEFPSPTSTQTRKRPSFVRDREREEAEPRSEERPIDDESGRQPTQAPVVDEGEDERPEYLASELLRQDWFPRTPLRRTLRWGSVVLGLAGVATAFALGGLAGSALGLTALFALCAVAGVVPLEPEWRGATLAVIGASGATWLGYLGTQDGAGAATPLLIGCVTLTVAALLFRAAHRTSKLARILVALGLIATAGYLFLTGGISGMIVESMDWQSWVVPVSRLLLSVIVLLAALSFLDPTGHGGAWIAGFALLAWLAIDAGGSLALAAWPVRAPHAAPTVDAWLVTGALPLFAALTAGGLCQLLALVSHRQHGKPAPTSEPA